MTSRKLWISSDVRRAGDAAEILKEFARETGISGKDEQHLNLLTEETLGMAGSKLKDFEGEILLQETPEGYRILLEADVREPEAGERTEMLPAEGFMAKVAEMLNCSYVFESAADAPESIAEMLPDYFSYGVRGDRSDPAWAGNWSLTDYREHLRQVLKGNPEAAVEMDELEKSIVARLADEVTIGILGRKVRLVIEKKVKKT